MATIPLTKRGAEILKAELHKLKTVERPWVINAISEARAQGDLSENAEYDAAKDRQGFIEGRIQEVEGKLSAAQVIDPAALDAGGRIVFGTTVELEEEETGERVTYQIVGEDEADLKLGLINISSPIARALIGKEEGDTAVVIAPGGDKAYEIVGVRYVPWVFCRADAVCLPTESGIGGFHGRAFVWHANRGVWRVHGLIAAAGADARQQPRVFALPDACAMGAGVGGAGFVLLLGIRMDRLTPHPGT